MLEEIRPDFKFNTVSMRGAQFKESENYIPNISLGKTFSDFNTPGDAFINDLLDAMKAGNPSSSIPNSKSGFANKRNEGIIDGIYYDNNIMSVMDKFLSKTLYDIHTTKELMVLSRLLSDPEVASHIGKSNTNIIRNSVVHMVTGGRGRFVNYSSVVKAIEKIKNHYAVAAMGNVGQWATQFLPTIPMIVAHAGPINTMKALVDLTRSDDSFYMNNTIGLKVRNYMNEKFDPHSSFNEKGVKQKFSQLSDKIEDITTWGLRRSDMYAARLAFLASLRAQGADMKNPTQEQISQAEREASLLQNTSNKNALPQMLTPTGDASRIAISFAMSFRSFALQQMLNTHNSLFHLNKKEARKMFIANVASIMAFQAMAKVISNQYENLAGVIANALGYGMDAEDDEEKKKDESYIDPYKAISDLAVGGGPEQLQAALEALYEHANEHNQNSIATKFNENRSPYEEDMKKYNKYADSKFFIKEGNYLEMFGAYSKLTAAGVNAYDIITNKLMYGNEIKKSEMLQLTADLLTNSGIFNSGDISKLLRKQIAAAKAEERKKKTPKYVSHGENYY